MDPGADLGIELLGLGSGMTALLGCGPLGEP
jgi:hypothetical protein